MKAILVLGGESTGTRMMTRILCGMGFYGDGDHFQRLDNAIPQYPAIVWRRSVPHAGVYPPIKQMIATLTGMGYSVSALVMTRDWHCAAKSQVAAGHTKTEAQALEQLRRAYAHIHEQLGGTPFKMVSYEGLIQRPEKVIWQVLDLPAIKDSNQKYYE